MAMRALSVAVAVGASVFCQEIGRSQSPEREIGPVVEHLLRELQRDADGSGRARPIPIMDGLNAPRDPLRGLDDPVGLALTQPEWRRIAREDLESGRVRAIRPTIQFGDDRFFWNLGAVSLDWRLPGAAHAQYRVELIRMTRSNPESSRNWEPTLRAVERLIAEELDYLGDCRARGFAPDPQALDRFRDRRSAIYEDFIGTIAVREQCRAVYVEPSVFGQRNERDPIDEEGPGHSDERRGRVDARLIMPVRVSTPDNRGVIMLAPKGQHRVDRAYGRDTDFISVQPGTRHWMPAGEVAYYIRYPDGSMTPVRYHDVPPDARDRGVIFPP